MNDNTLESQACSQPYRRLEFNTEIDVQDASQCNEDVKQDVLFNTGDMLDEEPKLGMEFSSEESAYNFYNNYAKKIGFSARRGWIQKSDEDVMVFRQFCCSKEGRKREKKQTDLVRSTRPITRTNCKASMMIKLQKNGKYSVNKFVAEHNHEVVTPTKVHMLRSHRSLTDDQKADIDIINDSGITPRAGVEYFSRKAGGRENMGFTSIDYKNYLQRKRMKAMEKGDAGAVLEYFQQKQIDDPSFFYAIQVDKDDQMTNMFWADERSIVDYSVFGDVICFDTTYRINSYGWPFAPFIGVNHHKQTVIFGVALLYDETIESFKSLFQTFLSAMSGKQPMTILTDQDAAMANAIASVMSETYHRLCIWHIYQNAAKHLSNVFNGSKSFGSDFSKCVYDYEEEEEFLTAWNNLLEKYDLVQNKWLQNLFKEREKWAMVYGRNTFCADMKSTQRSESMNGVLKKYLSSKYNLLRFFTHYERVVTERRYKESKADFNMRQSTPVLFADIMMLNEAAKVYTPEIFEIFQDEYKKWLSHAMFKCGESGTVVEFRVVSKGKVKGHTIRFDSLDSTVRCSCKKFEFVGILCSHALKVLNYYNIDVLHPRYILKRWQRDVKVGYAKDYTGLTIQGDRNVTSGKRYNHLCHKLLKVAAIAREHEEVFKVANRYANIYHDQVVDCMKRIKELPLMSVEVVEESEDDEPTRHLPTKSVDTKHAHSESIESLHTED
ncbi:protein FAR1-RELATED SEQUENCE 5-like [Magnolia sinica]|uniref:protein FAR1-RELATED SEQUENCE 5-like n=1 Tax=Magnolia sinica TaxID=86752 RepID=UPI002658EA89|nr:protein FAR1-RELATED SEQUENCE 5-like [Magnolia sinica]